MLGVVSNRTDILIARREIDPLEAIGMRDRALAAELVPDRIRILGPLLIKVIEVGEPVG
jgi:hypothetical protein